MAASEHELKFKASVDMSQANAQIQQAAKQFNLGLVRRAVDMFGTQLTDLATNAGLKDFAEEVRKATSAVSDAIGVYNATRNFGSNIQAMATAASIATSALNAWGAAVNKSIAAMDRATKLIEDANTKQTNAKFSSQFANKDLEGKIGMRDRFQDTVAKNQSAYDSAVAALENKRSELASKGIVGDAINSTTRRELETLADAVEAARMKLEGSQNLLDKWNAEIVSEQEKIAKDLERAAEQEIKERERIAEAERKEAERIEAQKQTTADIFRQFDKSEMFDAIRNDPNKDEIAKNNIAALEEVLQQFREAAERGDVIDNDALREVLSDLATYRGMLGKDEAKKEEASNGLNMDKTLEAMSGLAAIGGSVAGEATQKTVDQNIEQTMKFTKEILDMVGKINNTMNS